MPVLAVVTSMMSLPLKLMERNLDTHCLHSHLHYPKSSKEIRILYILGKV